MQTLIHKDYTVKLFTEERCRGIVYAVMDSECAEETWNLLRGRGMALAAVTGVDWNRDLSPWQASRAFRSGPDFSGGGAAFLDLLTQTLLPLTEARLPDPPAFRGIAGYSLAGLFALWAVSRSPHFNRAASVSGSLWYDGFLDYLGGRTIQADFVYLSLGDREKAARNPRLSAVEDCTLQAVDLLRAQGVPVQFELNPGGHFQDVSVRLARALHAVGEWDEVCTDSKYLL